MCMCLHTGDSFEDDLAKSTRIHLGTHMAEYVSVNTEHFGGSDSRYIGSDRFREFEMILSELLRPSPEVEWRQNLNLIPEPIAQKKRARSQNVERQKGAK